MLSSRPGKAQLIFAVEWIGVFAVATAVSISFVDQSAPFLRAFIFLLTLLLLWWAIVRLNLLPPPENEDDVVSGRLGEGFIYSPDRHWIFGKLNIAIIVAIALSVSYEVIINVLSSVDIRALDYARVILRPFTDLLFNIVPFINIAFEDFATTASTDQRAVFINNYTFHYLVSFLAVSFLFSKYFYNYSSYFFSIKILSVEKNWKSEKYKDPKYKKYCIKLSHRWFKGKFGEIMYLLCLPLFIMITFIINPYSFSHEYYVLVRGDIMETIVKAVLFYVGPLFVFILVFAFVCILKYRQMSRDRAAAQIQLQAEE